MLPLSSILHSHLPLPTSRKDGWAREQSQLCTLQKEGNLPGIMILWDQQNIFCVIRSGISVVLLSVATSVRPFI